MSGWAWRRAPPSGLAFLTVRSLRGLQAPLLRGAGYLPWQALRIDRFGNVAVAPGAEDLLPVPGHGVGGQRHDDDAAHARIGSDLAGDPQPILSPKLNIHQ